MKIVSKSVVSVIIALFLSLSSQFALASGINVNTASALVLAEQMKGVGEKKAQAIVVYRAKHGPFQSLDDLTKVKGIGNATVNKNRSILVIGQADANSNKQNKAQTQ